MPIKLFSKQIAPLIGLDVSPAAVIMVELGHIKNGRCIERFAIEALEPNVYMDGDVARPDELCEAIGRCHAKLKTKTKAVAMGLPTESTFIKRLTISSLLTEEEMERDVASALSSLMLIDASDINVDFQTLDPEVTDKGNGEEGGYASASESDSESQEVLAIAAKKSKIEDLLVPIENAGLRVVKVDAQTLAIHTLIDEIATTNGNSIMNKNQAIVQLGENALRFTVLRNGEAIYTRDAMFGTSQLVSDLVMRLGLPEEDVKKIMQGLKNEPEGYEEVVKQHIETATQEINRAMQLFMTSTSHVGVDAVLLHDEGSRLSGLPEAIEEAIGMPCRILDPLEGLKIAPGASHVVEQSHRLVAACGLAYRRFDL